MLDAYVDAKRAEKFGNDCVLGGSGPWTRGDFAGRGLLSMNRVVFVCAGPLLCWKEYCCDLEDCAGADNGVDGE